jgi:hypothetical protein
MNNKELEAALSEVLISEFCSLEFINRVLNARASGALESAADIREKSKYFTRIADYYSEGATMKELLGRVFQEDFRPVGVGPKIVNVFRNYVRIALKRHVPGVETKEARKYLELLSRE